MSKPVIQVELNANITAMQAFRRYCQRNGFEYKASTLVKFLGERLQAKAQRVNGAFFLGSDADSMSVKFDVSFEDANDPPA